MTDKNNNPIYNINVYYFENKFYILGLVRMPPLSMRTPVLPLYIVPDNDTKKLVQDIELARLGSNVEFCRDKSISDRIPWDKKDDKVSNNAKKLWDIIWREDGSVSINPAIPYVKHRWGMEWIFVKDAKKILPSPVSALDIAKEILSQLKK